MDHSLASESKPTTNQTASINMGRFDQRPYKKFLETELTKYSKRIGDPVV